MCFGLAFAQVVFLRIVHVVACFKRLLLFTAEENSLLWMYHNLFFHKPVDGDLSCFQFGQLRVNLL